MPQLDLETLVSLRGGSGRKIACETLADGGAAAPEVPDADVPSDFPPESFWLSKDAELDWFEQNAFFERKESTKGNSNSPARNPNSSSQRFSLTLKSKAAIIGLPKTQKTSYCDTKRRNCKPPIIRLFPKRTESIGKSAEPSSPKVSCMGRVRSKRGRRRSAVRATETGKPADREITNGRRRTGFYSGLMAILGSGRSCRGKSSVKIKESIEEVSPRKSVTTRAREFQDAEPPGLGGMARFASGRRSESWSAEEIDVARSDWTDTKT